MTVQTDIQYLPVLIPARVTVDSGALTRQRTPPPQIWQPRIYRIPGKQPAGSIIYGPGAMHALNPQLGGIIDLYA
jgi:hypothetical protein